ncbi:hypothetical protein OG613_14925 [Streptomyces sp. NBC_00015]|uniref:hypothetical protein n=1 Tax=Streptomyces sp. NBC_00015 TaxID=2903611 RepID=UPI0032515F76
MLCSDFGEVDMRLASYLVTGALLPPIIFMGMAEEAEAATTHVVTVRGRLSVHDSPGVFAGGETKHRYFNRTFKLGHANTRASWGIPVCADGETLGELRIRLRLNSLDETVTTNVSLALYEWVECDHADLEDKFSAPSREVVNGGRGDYNLTVKSREPGNDWAYALFSVTHDFAAPVEPTDVTVTRQPPDRTERGLRHIRIEWQDSSADEKGYEIQNIANPGSTRRVGPNRTFYDWAALGRGLACFRVRALGDPTPSDWSALVCA